MPMFRKLPVEIEAMQVPSKFETSNVDEHGALVGWMYHNAGERQWKIANEDGEIDIETLEGTMRARNGDWIIKGVAGELYPCKPDIFEQTYEPVV